MERNRFAATGVRAICAGTLALLSASAPAETYRFSTYINEADIRYSAFQHFGNLLKERTGGRVTLQIFGSGSLHPFDKGIDAVLGGISDIASAAGFDKGRMPCAYLTTMMPAAIDWDRHVELDLEFTAILKPELDKIGVVNVMSQNFSYDQEWFFRKPVASLNDLKGQLIRTNGPLVSHASTVWGGKPVFIAPKEVYQSAERGVVDGINMGIATFSSWKLWEVMPHMVAAKLFYGNVLYVMNKAKFEKLSPQDQKAMLAAGVDTARWLKPRYEKWINEQVGQAVLQGNGSARAIVGKEREQLIASVAAGWNDKMDEMCGADAAKRLRALFEKYKK
jgi:TRAP-type C4-dicarboxylate transport system substrate-binding protein